MPHNLVSLNLCLLWRFTHFLGVRFDRMKPCTYEKHKLISFTSSNGTITSYLCCWFSRIKKNAFSLCPVWLASVASYRGWGIWGMASASTQSAQKEDCSFLKHVNSEYTIGLQGNHLSVFQFCDSCPETTYGWYYVHIYWWGRGAGSAEQGLFVQSFYVKGGGCYGQGLSKPN